MIHMRSYSNVNILIMLVYICLLHVTQNHQTRSYMKRRILSTFLSCFLHDFKEHSFASSVILIYNDI